MDVETSVCQENYLSRQSLPWSRDLGLDECQRRRFSVRTEGPWVDWI